MINDHFQCLTLLGPSSQAATGQVMTNGNATAGGTSFNVSDAQFAAAFGGKQTQGKRTSRATSSRKKDGDVADDGICSERPCLFVICLSLMFASVFVNFAQF